LGQHNLYNPVQQLLCAMIQMTIDLAEAGAVNHAVSARVDPNEQAAALVTQTNIGAIKARI
jgi:hypothetical protein